MGRLVPIARAIEVFPPGKRCLEVLHLKCCIVIQRIGLSLEHVAAQDILQEQGSHDRSHDRSGESGVAWGGWGGGGKGGSVGRVVVWGGW